MMCFNWKVLAGLGVAALAVWAVAPGAFVVALPVLVIAACPLSMLFMMRSMSGSGASCERPADDAAVDDVGAEVARLRAEVAQLRAQRAARTNGDTHAPALPEWSRER